MTHTGRYKSLRIALLIAFFVSFAGCSSTQPANSAKVNIAAPQFSLYINFNGPWAFMPNPDDPTQLLAIAPVVQGHGTAYIGATNETPVNPGVYQLTGIQPSNLVANPQLVVVNDTISKQTLKDTLGNTGKRYVIKLPMPTALSSYRTGLVAVSSSFPVANPKTIEKQYTSHMTFSYTVPNYGGIKIEGTDDKRMPLSFLPMIGATGSMDIGVGPLYDIQEDDCHNHAKTAFKALADLLKLKKIIDYPNYNQGVCMASDPQNPNGTGKPANNGLGMAGADCKPAMMVLDVQN